MWGGVFLGFLKTGWESVISLGLSLGLIRIAQIMAHTSRQDDQHHHHPFKRSFQNYTFLMSLNSKTKLSIYFEPITL